MSYPAGQSETNEINKKLMKLEKPAKRRSFSISNLLRYFVITCDRVEKPDSKIYVGTNGSNARIAISGTFG